MKWGRTATLVAVLVATLVMVVAAASTPRAEVVGVNRPPLERPALAGVCWPLPGVERFAFAFQTRADVFELVGVDEKRRRLLTLQFDLVDGSAAAAEVDERLDEAGFRAAAPPSWAEPSTAGWAWFERADFGLVGRRVEDLRGVPADGVVRGTLLLDLPSSSYREDQRGLCSRPRPANAPGAVS